MRPKSNGSETPASLSSACFRKERQIAMNKYQWFLLSAALLLLGTGGCSTASITNTWKDPTFAGPIHFKKVVALVIHPDSTVRRVAEDEIVHQIGPERSVAAYTFVTEDERQDADKLKAKLESSGVDGAVTMRLLGKRSETTYVPG